MSPRSIALVLALVALAFAGCIGDEADPAETETNTKTQIPRELPKDEKGEVIIQTLKEALLRPILLEGTIKVDLLELTVVRDPDCDHGQKEDVPYKGSYVVLDKNGLLERTEFSLLPNETSKRFPIAVKGEPPFVLAGDPIACLDAANTRVDNVTLAKHVDGLVTTTEDTVTATIAQLQQTAVAPWNENEMTFDLVSVAPAQEVPRGITMTFYGHDGGAWRQDAFQYVWVDRTEAQVRQQQLVYMPGGYKMDVTHNDNTPATESEDWAYKVVSRHWSPAACAEGFVWQGLC
ncbi:MAG: hypothetical protein KY455_07285 [Euryarchaeota archaeon]|nr:hypothetical protein [Euryarchaeota archaeon]